MSDKKPNETGRPAGTPAAKAKANGTTPTVSARRPISKDEYARTTKSTPDATSVIPAVRDDKPAPAPKQSRPEVDDRPTETFKAVSDSGPAPAEPKQAPKPPDQKKPEPTKRPGIFDKPEAKKAEPAKKPESQESATPNPAGPAPGVAFTGGIAGAAAAAAPPAAAPAPTEAKQAPKPEPKKPEVKKAEPKKPEPVKAPEQKKPEPQAAPTKVAPAASTQSAASTAPATAPSGRSARLKLNHIEPWSVTKMSFVVAVALMVVSVVAVTVFWTVLQITGVWGALNDSVSNVLADDAAAFDITEYLGFGRVVGVTLLVSSLNVIFMTALATIAAHLYNLAATILGGVELTFGERE